MAATRVVIGAGVTGDVSVALSMTRFQSLISSARVTPLATTNPSEIESISFIVFFLLCLKNVSFERFATCQTSRRFSFKIGALRRRERIPREHLRFQPASQC